MQYHFTLLLTDQLYWLLWLAIVFSLGFSLRQQHIRLAFSKIGQSYLGVASGVILAFFLAISLLDSIHFAIHYTPGAEQVEQDPTKEVVSVLDRILAPLGTEYEASYSEPMALFSFAKVTRQTSTGGREQYYPRLLHAGTNVIDLKRDYWTDIYQRLARGVIVALVLSIVFSMAVVTIIHTPNSSSWRVRLVYLLRGKSSTAWRTGLITFIIMLLLTCCCYSLSRGYHIFGTDKVGQDVFYETLKSIRTGLVIGTLTTVLTLPFALLLGMLAGYFGGVIDDAIQYCYTTLNSIPGVLLIAAAILAMQIFMANHPTIFPTIASRMDARLLALCLILGVTSWTGLCRLLRAETLKVRELDYVNAARTMGVSHFKIILRHVLPNVFYLVIIAIAIDFSSLVLAEAVLSAVGVGVDPSTNSWGNMINAARLQLAREPVVWWPLVAAFIFMFVLVLAANLFADVVRDAFDPRE